MTNKYYQKHKERFVKVVLERYQILSEEEKEKRRKNREKYQNHSEKQKRNILEYMRNYHLEHKK